MTLLKELTAELIGMFFGDAQMTIAVLLLVGVAAILIELTGLDPLLGGAVLALGCPLLLITNLHRDKVRLRR